jgi:hypothetical protein
MDNDRIEGSARQAKGAPLIDECYANLNAR